mgnify:CR=1 FL=1
MKAKPETEVRIIYNRAGFESKVGHPVRTKMEAKVCDWLMSHRIAHRHASEIFTVRVGPAGMPAVYVPDIILHDRDKSGRTVIIEPFEAYTPKAGSTRIIATFRKEMQKDYYVIIITKKNQVGKILKDAYDVMLDIDRLDELEKKLPQAPR